MSFGKKLLEKYGWSEGQGLGKDNQGIAKPISTQTQTNTKGIGTDQASFVNWWDDLYSNTLSKINSVSSTIKAPENSFSSTDKSDKEKLQRKRKDKKDRKHKKREGKVKKK
jgi:G-patch domain